MPSSIIQPMEFEFSAEFIKINHNTNEIITSFKAEFFEVALSYEHARTQALNKAQAIIREFSESDYWYFRLDYEM